MCPHIDTELDVAIVGAGFAGLYALRRLRDTHGLRCRVYEVDDTVGGTWSWNRYPGARCDTESSAYCYSFSRELYEGWNWSGKYPTQPELQQYFEHVTDTFDLRRDIQFQTHVESAHYCDEHQRWLLTTGEGERISARYFVSCIGNLTAAPYVPELPGLESFQGQVFHTSRWPKEGVDFTGKRVGVIGTGSSGVQAIPEIAKTAEHVTTFQRSPAYAVPARHEWLDEEFLQSMRDDYDGAWDKVRWSAAGFPFHPNGRSALDDGPAGWHETLDALWNMGGLRFMFANYTDVLTDRRANEVISQFVRARIRETVHDSVTAERLMPRDYPMGTKRPIVETGYFDAYNRGNVSLADIRHFPIEEVTPTGIRTGEGHFDLDFIVLATGFDAVTGPFMLMDIRGRAGLELQQVWETGPVTNLGLATAGFPNMFMVRGPGAPVGNAPVTTEHHVEWLGTLIEYMADRGFAAVDVDPVAQEDWVAFANAGTVKSLIPLTPSWFTGANIPGKTRGVYIFVGSYADYRNRLDEVAASGYPGFHFEETSADDRGSVALAPTEASR